MSVVFITFAQKLKPEEVKALLPQLRSELNKKIGNCQIVFMRKPPSGKKFIFNINNQIVIATVPYQEHKNIKDAEDGFKLGDIIKMKSKKA